MKWLLTIVYLDENYPQMWEFDGMPTQVQHELPVYSYSGICDGKRVLVCIPVNRADYWTLEEVEEE